MIEGVKGLRALGVDCHMVLPWNLPVASPWLELEAPRIYAPVEWWSYPADLSFAMRTRLMARVASSTAILARRLRAIAPDLIITNTSVTPVAALAARLLGVPHIWYIHEFGREDHGLNFALGRTLSVRAIAALSARVIVNSRAVGAHFADLLSEAKTRLLYSGVEVPAAAAVEPREGKTFRLVIVGSLSPGKRQEDAIRALSLLMRKGVASHLTIVGPGDDGYAADLRRLTAELGLEAAVSFVSETDTPYPYYASAQLSLICSRHEAFGRVTIEAMKMGRPVVGARSGATVEIIRDGFNGFLYEPCDPADLAQKIETVIRDPALRLAMGRNARQWANETFDMQIYATALQAILREAMGKRANAETMKLPIATPSIPPVIGG